jgi:hypothetical protein
MLDSRHWERNAHGPDDFSRPKIEHVVGIFLIFKDGHDLNIFWKDIELATETGRLGHYSAFSPGEGVICVHHYNAWDMNERRAIRERIEKILVIPWDIRYITQRETYHIQNEK